MRKFDWGKAGGLLFIVFIFWMLNFNSALKRYNDQIAACEYSKIHRDRPSSLGWQSAEFARWAAWARDHNREDLGAAQEYHAIHVSYDKVIATPCRDRFTAPGPFG